jgi:hypothetical protein
MAKSAAQKFDEYLSECRETRNTINEIEKASREKYDGSYAYSCGVFSMMLGDVIAQLPKAKRVEMRQQMIKIANQLQNDILIKTIKEAA